MSIETFVVTNFLMNFLLLAIAARCAGHVCWRRTAAGATLGAIYAALCYTEGGKWLGHPLLQALMLLVMALIAFGKRRRRTGRGYLFLLCGVAFAGGVMTLLSRWLRPGGILLTAAGWIGVVSAAVLTDGAGRTVGNVGSVRLRVDTKQGGVEFDALVDTGNRLREPLSGLPVLIVGRRSLGNAVDAENLNQVGSRMPPGFRMVRYGALGGGGEMLCFKPESVCVWKEGAWREAPDLWVAIYPGDMPSGLEALAPPVFESAEMRRGQEFTNRDGSE